MEYDLAKGNEGDQPADLPGEVVPDLIGRKLSEIKSEGDVHDVTKWQCVDG